MPKHAKNHPADGEHHPVKKHRGKTAVSGEADADDNPVFSQPVPSSDPNDLQGSGD